MKCRALFISLIACALATAAHAQTGFVQVTATVVDPQGFPYSNGTVSADLIPDATNPTVNGTPFSGHLGPAQLDLNGTFNMTLADNNLVQPSGTQWQFRVCANLATVQWPVGRGSQCFALTLTITGTTQNITTNLNAIATSLTNVCPNANITPPSPITCGNSSGGGCSISGIPDSSVLLVHPANTCDGNLDFTWSDSALILQAGNANSIATGNTNIFVLNGNNTLSAPSGATIVNAAVIGDHNTDSVQTAAEGELYQFGDSNANTNVAGSDYQVGSGNINQDAGDNLVQVGIQNTFHSSVPGTSVALLNDDFAFGEFNTITSIPGGDPEEILFAGFQNQAIITSASGSISDFHVLGNANRATSSTANGVNELYIVGQNNIAEDIANQTNQVEIVGENNTINGSVSTAQILGFKNSLTNVSFSGGTSVNTTVVGTQNIVSNTGHSGQPVAVFGIGISLHDCQTCIAIGSGVTVSTDGEMGIGMSATPQEIITGSEVEFTIGMTAGGATNVSGCSLASQNGGAWAGSFASGTTGTCTVTITPGTTAPNGWVCQASDITTTADTIKQTASSTTTCTIAGTTTSGDRITWSAFAF